MQILDNTAFAMTNIFRRQHKRINLDKVYNKLIKTIDSENTNKEHPNNWINELTIQEKIIHQPKRNYDS